MATFINFQITDDTAGQQTTTTREVNPEWMAQKAMEGLTIDDIAALLADGAVAVTKEAQDA